MYNIFFKGYFNDCSSRKGKHNKKVTEKGSAVYLFNYYFAKFKLIREFKSYIYHKYGKSVCKLELSATYPKAFQILGENFGGILIYYQSLLYILTILYFRKKLIMIINKEKLITS
jgi:hypothetical protein